MQRSRTSDPAHAETVAYVGDMAEQLARMARGARQELLAYFLTMAWMEAEAIVGEREHEAAPDGAQP